MVSANWERMGTNSFKRQDGFSTDRSGENPRAWPDLFPGIFSSCCHIYACYSRERQTGKLWLNQSPSGSLEAPFTLNVLSSGCCTSWEEQGLSLRGRGRRNTVPLKWRNLLGTLSWLPVLHLRGGDIQSKWQKATLALWIPSAGKFSNLSKSLSNGSLKRMCMCSCVLSTQILLLMVVARGLSSLEGASLYLFWIRKWRILAIKVKLSTV